MKFSIAYTKHNKYVKDGEFKMRKIYLKKGDNSQSYTPKWTKTRTMVHENEKY